jgi:hypothetical protein
MEDRNRGKVPMQLQVNESTPQHAYITQMLLKPNIQIKCLPRFSFMLMSGN